MGFTPDQIGEIEAGYASIRNKYENLMLMCVSQLFNNARAREFATQGLARRLKIATRCIDRVFEILPPGRTEIPDADKLSDATIYIQAYIFNVFGCLDNLA